MDGVLLEMVRKNRQNLRLVRGWFRMRAGGPQTVHFAPKGRWIEVSMSSTDGRASITLKPPSWWKHPPYAWATIRVNGTKPQRLWLPEGATGVVVNRKREIPLDRIGEKLVLD